MSVVRVIYLTLASQYIRILTDTMTILGCMQHKQNFLHEQNVMIRLIAERDTQKDV